MKEAWPVCLLVTVREGVASVLKSTLSKSVSGREAWPLSLRTVEAGLAFMSVIVKEVWPLCLSVTMKRGVVCISVG